MTVRLPLATNTYAFSGDPPANRGTYGACWSDRLGSYPGLIGEQNRVSRFPCNQAAVCDLGVCETHRQELIGANP